MTFLTSILTRAASPTAADRALKAKLQAKFVKQLWFFLAAVIAFFTVVNVISRISSALMARAKDTSSVNEKRGNESTGRRGNGKVSLRRLPSALASTFRTIAFRTTVPIGPASVASVTEVVFVLGYVLPLLIWTWIDTRNMQYYFFEDRAAHLASCQLPLIVALAGKNNLISFLTGVGHEKLNVLHRASGRVCLLLLWVHAVARTLAGLSPKINLTHDWMQWGVVGLAALTLATILSVRPLRMMAFEFFLISHIVLIVIFLVGGYLHAKHPEYGDYIWPALLVWGVDRFLRLVLLIWNNRFWRSSDNLKATVEILSQDTIRLTLRRRLSWKPGQHAYVMLPSISNLPTEAHPFTIANIPNHVDGTKGSGEREVVFLVRGRTGFTGKLREYAIRNPSSLVPAYIDGPYGCPPNLKFFNTCVLIAGGSGVSYTLPLLMDLVHQARAGKSAVRRIFFIWIIRDPEHLNWISELLTEALNAAPSSLEIESCVYITGAKGVLPNLYTLEYEQGNPPSTPTSSDDEKKAKFTFTTMKTREGRPDINGALHDIVVSANGPVSVDVSGPSTLAQSVRSALSSETTSSLAVLKGRASVTLHVETFGMVKG